MGTVIGIGVALYGAYKQSEAGWQAREDARANAADIAAEGAESARRLKKEQDKVLAETKARAAASGIQAGGTLDVYLSEMRKNFELERAWVSKSTFSKAAAERRGGRYQQSIAQAGAWGTIASGISALY